MSVCLSLSVYLSQVFWKGGGSDVYPYLWLRDNCQCPNCFHPIAFARMVLLDHLHPDTVPKSVQVSGINRHRVGVAVPITQYTP
ncbi:MAG: gamma-butyrobetaine hydroxylase-like domain-containing protein [Marinicella pacifica]